MIVCSYENSRRTCVGAMLALTCLLGSISTIFAQGATQSSAASAEQVAKGNITFKVIAVGAGGYGYDVFVDGKKLIHQPNIPGQAGVTGFKTKEDSQKVAELVIRKLKNKEMPPAITEEELRQLKVIN